MPHISTHLWFDKEAKEAADLYVRTFPGAKLKSSTTLKNTPSGDTDIVIIDVMGHEIQMISAGPLFKINPSISFLVNLPTEEDVEKVYRDLAEGGKPLMELGNYPFSKKYGWIQDKYGVSWQLMLDEREKPGQAVIPTLMFTQDKAGNAEEAVNFYVSVFKNSRLDDSDRYPEGGPTADKPGTIRHAGFVLEGQELAAMDSAQVHDFTFNEAVSIIVKLDTQEEIDYYWEKLSAVPESEQCGWLKDKFGVVWQIVPSAMDELMGSDDQAKIDRVTQAFLKMKKFDIAELERAAEGK